MPTKGLHILVIILFAGFSGWAQITPAQLDQRKQEKLHSIVPAQSHSRGGAPEQDCNSAIAVCQGSYFQPTAYSGYGVIQEVPSSSYLGSSEKNSVWYIFTVQAPGTFTFTISPIDNTDDYDFALYNLTGRNCSDIVSGNAPEVRCNFCVEPGNTGISAAGANPSEDCCTNPDCQFNSILNVTAGQSYALIVSNYSSSQSGYALTFGGTAVLFDNAPPGALSVTTPCGANSLTLQMLEMVLCSSITPSGSEFTLSGPGGPFTVSSATGINCGNATSQIMLNISAPLVQGSNYVLTFNNGTDFNTLIDNCGNIIPPGTTFNFIPAPPRGGISGPASVCSGSAVTLTASQGTSYLWSPGGQTTGTITVSPTVATTYSVTVTNGACMDTASHRITTQPSPTARFNYSPNPVCDQVIQFTDSSTTPGFCLTSGNTCTTNADCVGGVPFCIPGIFSSYLWDFGDGSTSVGSGATHVYDSSGTYLVTLTVTNQGGCRATASEVFNIACAGDIISGAIATEQGIPVAGVTVNLSGSDSAAVITGNNGYYSFNTDSGGSYTVSPSKNNDVTTGNGISTLDILLIRRHILNISLLSSPYKVIAADVNASGDVTTLDLLLVRSLILQTTQTFPNNRLWAFVPGNHVFSNPQNPFPFPDSIYYNNITASYFNQHFTGIKLGDVNDSWDSNIPKRDAVGAVRLLMDEFYVQPGDEVMVPVRVKDFNGIAGYQFTLSWDKEVLSLLEVSNKSLDGFYGEYAADEGALTTLWYDEMTKGVTLSDDEAVFELKFKVVGAEGLQSEIKIGSELTASEAYNENLDLLNIVPANGMVKVGNGNSLNTQRSTPIALSVQPNPFSNITNIIFTIPRDATVTLAVYDLVGKKIKNMKADYMGGEHIIAWQGDDDAGRAIGRGLYHIRMEAGGYVNVVKVVLIN